MPQDTSLCDENHTSSYISLPPELMGKIFMAVVSGTSITGIRTTLQTLALVSQQWCDVVHTTPHLWTALSVNLDNTDDLNDGLQTSISRFFSHSGTLPLGLTVSSGLTTLRRSSCKYLSSLRPWAARLSTLDISLPERVAISEFQPAVSSESVRKVSYEWSRLKTLKLRIQHDMLYDEFTFPDIDDLAVAQVFMPLLVDFDIRTTSIHRWVPNFPWAQLVRLKITLTCLHFRGEAIFRILRQCRDLEEFTLCTAGNVSSVGEDHDQSPISLPKLRKLALRIDIANPGDRFDSLLLALRLPALESLNLKGGGLTPSALQCLVHESSCKLRGLTLDCPQLGDMECMKILDVLKDLETLRISDRRRMSRQFNHVHRSFDSCGFLPRLRDLTWEVGFALHEYLNLKKAFNRAVSRRNEGHGSLAGCTCSKLQSSSFRFIAQKCNSTVG